MFSTPILYQIISTAFCVLVVVSDIISAKMLHLPFFGDFSIPCGLITYPLTFLLSDLTTEIYGARQAKITVYIAFGMTLLGFGIIKLALMLPAIPDAHEAAFQSILGLNGLIIFSSLTAFVIAQILDIQLYAWIRSLTGDRFLWLRNNGSTLLSQIADTVAVNLIHLYWGLGFELSTVIQIMFFSYTYKAFFSVANTPLFYLLVYLARFNWRRFFKKVKAAEV